MIRLSEMVLPGHPDKFCDQVADAVIAECVRVDADAFGQVEVAVWGDSVWLTGGICTRRPLPKSMREIVLATGDAVGYVTGNSIDVARYEVTSAVRQRVGDPGRWTRHVNDQAVVVGWAGYDEKTVFLPPEHFAAHVFRDALEEACAGGQLKGQGPDGKLMVRLREEGDRRLMEHVLVTIQQRESARFAEVCRGVASTLRAAYEKMREADGRWRGSWNEVELLVNPNGPLVCAGSESDNGQTGRKLVVDFYGPRVPVGGGALSGKHLGHIDRVAAYAARDAAVRAVRSGAEECLVRLSYAPNVPGPLDVRYEMTGRGERQAADFFDHAAMVSRYPAAAITARLGQGRHFYDATLPWNRGAGNER